MKRPKTKRQIMWEMGGYELGRCKSAAEGDRARSSRTALSPAFRPVVRVKGAGVSCNSRPTSPHFRWPARGQRKLDP